MTLRPGLDLGGEELPAAAQDVRDARMPRFEPCSEKGVRLAQMMQVGPCIPVGMQLWKAVVGPTFGPTWRLSHFGGLDSLGVRGVLQKLDAEVDGDIVVERRLVLPGAVRDQAAVEAVHGLLLRPRGHAQLAENKQWAHAELAESTQQGHAELA